MRSAAILALLGAFALSSCSRSPATPRGTIEAYLNAGKRGARVATSELIQEKDRKFLEEMGKGMGKEIDAEMTSEPPEDFSYRVVDEKISGDTATVTVALTYGGKEHTQKMRLVREGGQWKIDLFSEEQMEAMSSLKRLTEAAKKQAAGAKPAVSDEDMKKIEAFIKSLEDEEEDESEK